MQRSGRSLLALLGILQLIFLLTALEQPAQAYADPGSGLFMFQVASSMVAGAIFFLRVHIRKLLGRSPPPEEAAGSTGEAAGTEP